MFFKKSAEMPTTETALPGRDVPMPVEFAHAIYNRDLRAPDPEGFERLYVGMGCFWGAERKFWQLDGVYLTAVPGRRDQESNLPRGLHRHDGS